MSHGEIDAVARDSNLQLNLVPFRPQSVRDLCFEVVIGFVANRFDRLLCRGFLA